MSCVLAGLWWFGLSLYTFRYLHARPGPPLPEGKGYVRSSWEMTCATLREVRQLPVTFKYLASWIVYSDGFTVIGVLGSLFANTEVEYGCLDKSTAIAILLIEVPICAAVGNWAGEKLVIKYDISDKAVVLLNLGVMASLPVYALVTARVVWISRCFATQLT